MYHGGRFSDNFYVGGDMTYIDYVDKDKMSMVEIGWMVKHLGYMDGIILYHYKLHGPSNAMTLLQFDDYPLVIYQEEMDQDLL
ncbi:hypothetical protein L3X38_042619 [Prunus dulcis]|uniref:PB1-like domain-containing protein n=1 Tax=Prunus dulcis TaxID=3755 RepID=A0AAD4UVJ0_PRUDU|nr:hypothetical protein L3X38_042619 [Prunus dulcis]